MKKQFLVLLTFISMIASSCGNDENLDESLFATWQVTKVEGLFYYNNIATIPVADNSPTGTVEFSADGTGYQSYSYQLGGNTYPNVGSFSWESTDDQIIIDRLNDPDMVWERITKLTNKQVAKYTIVVDGNQKWDYTLTLEK
jgi:hypothetical protein